ncbi:MAG: DNA-processing protein DprA [Elusimicrobiales bacterium]|jgi:DNA processing protein
MNGNTEEETLARVRLNAVACMRTDWLLRLITAYGGALEVLSKSAADLSADGGASPEIISSFMAELAAADPHKELEAARKAGVRVLTAPDKDYPELLKTIYDPPLALYVKGKLAPGSVPVGIVGTRRPTDYGARSAAGLSRGLVKAGLTVVSGLARGVDTIAHEAAVGAGGTTWAVMGTGLGMVYPPENKKLAERILEGGGALVSEFPMADGPRPAHFPRRNRIISGLSHATVVIEGDFKSGSLITAKAALEQGREVLALPGPVDSVMSRGPNMLIKNGAALVEDAEDVISALPADVLFGLVLPRRSRKEATVCLSGLSPDARAAHETIARGEGGLTVDGLVEALGWPVQRAAAALFELEASSLIIQSADKYKLTV